MDVHSSSSSRWDLDTVGVTSIWYQHIRWKEFQAAERYGRVWFWEAEAAAWWDAERCRPCGISSPRATTR